MSKPMSNREKKRVVSEGLRKLQSKAGWDPTKHATNDSTDLQRLGDVARADHLEDQATSCANCVTARAKSKDDTALCREHLAKVMGF